MIRRGDYDRIDIFAIEQLPEVIEGVAAESSALRLGVETFHHGLGTLPSILVDITNRRDLDFRPLQEIVEEISPLFADADKTQGEAIARFLCCCPDMRPQQQGCCGGDGGGEFEKSATGN